MNRGVGEPALPRPHAPGPGQQREEKAGHGGRHSPRMLRSSSRNSSRCCRRTCRASPPHRAVCKGRTYRGPGCGAAPAAAPRLGQGRGGEGRGRAAPSIARPAPGCGRPRPAGSPALAPAPCPGPTCAAASWLPPSPAAAFPPLPPIGGNGRHQGNREARGRGGARREGGGRGGTNFIARRSDQSHIQPRNTPSWKGPIKSASPIPCSGQSPTRTTHLETLSKRFLNSGRLVAVTPTLGSLFQCPTALLECLFLNLESPGPQFNLNLS